MSNILLKVEESFSGQRLDKFIARKLPEHSRSFLQNLIKLGNIKIDTKIIFDKSYKVFSGDICDINLTLDNHTEQKLAVIEPDNTVYFKIIYEDKFLLVIDKPRGLLTHPNNKQNNNTLVNGLKAYLQNEISKTNSQRPGIVHRLDQWTSGLMLVAKDNYTHAKLSNMLENRSVIRKYIALINGNIIPTQGCIVKNINVMKGNGLKMEVVSDKKGVNAITYYRVVEYYLKGNVNLIECKLGTGRTHQIRVHMEYKDCSVLGDKRYGYNINKINKSGCSKTTLRYLSELNSQALHAYILEFLHPVFHTKMKFFSVSQYIADIISVINAEY